MMLDNMAEKCHKDANKNTVPADKRNHKVGRKKRYKGMGDMFVHVTQVTSALGKTVMT